MKVAIICLAVVLGACGGWSKRDTLLEAGFAVTTAQDWRETDSIVQGCREQNALIGPCGDRLSPDAYMPIAIGLHAVVSALLPAGKLRTAWQVVTVGAEVKTLYGNHEIKWWLTQDPTLAKR